MDIYWLLMLSILHVCMAVNCPMPGLTSCDCTWTGDHHIIVINCTNQHIQNDRVLSQLLTAAPKIQRLIFTGNNLPELHQNLFGNCSGPYGMHQKLDHLTHVDFSNNGINIINGKTFHCVPSLKTLILNQNKWEVDPDSERVFSSMPLLEELQLTTAFYFNNTKRMDRLMEISKIFSGSHMTNLKVLHLDYNNIAYVDSRTFCGLPSLQRLYLSGNELNKIKMDCLENLKELYLDNNAIPYLTQSDFAKIINMSSLTFLNILQNPFQCTECTPATKTFRDWLKFPYSNIIANKEELYCVYPQKLSAKLLTDVTDKDLKGTCDFTDKSGKKSTNASTIVIGIIFAVIGIVSIVVIILNRWSIKKKFDKLITPLKESTIAKQFQYQYSTMDECDMESVEVVQT